MVVGSIAFAVTVISAAACWTARETYRTRIADLGHKGAVPVPKDIYDRQRAETITGAALAQG